MGLKCGHSINYSIDDLSFDNILTILNHRKMRRLSDTSGPVVDIDASWVVRRANNMSYDMRVSSLIRLCVLFINNGRVNVVFDGTTRHHTKRSTTKRTVDLYWAKVDYHVYKCELSSLVEDRKGLIVDDEIAAQDKKIEEMRKKMNTLKKDVRINNRCWRKTCNKSKRSNKNIKIQSI
jgi:hypothetical protein